MKPRWHVGVVSLFPDFFEPLIRSGVVGRAFESGLLQFDIVSPREFGHGTHRVVDDRPYGGGPGMVMMAEPLAHATEQLKSKMGQDTPVGYLSPQGKPFSRHCSQQLALTDKLILICGRYEGVDQRFIDEYVDFEISLGDYVLSGGEIAAMAVIDAAARWVPGVLGHELSAQEDSFSDGLLDCPHYTRPEVWRGQSVPDVLLSGHHKNIDQWRKKQALEKTKTVRPDLL